MDALTPMGVVESLPDRPLNRAEVDSLSESDPLKGCFPVYGERPQNRDTALGVVLILPSGAGKALAYLTDGWQVVDEAEFTVGDSSFEEGVRFDEMDQLDELQTSVAQYIAE